MPLESIKNIKLLRPQLPLYISTRASYEDYVNELSSIGEDKTAVNMDGIRISAEGSGAQAHRVLVLGKP